MMQSKQEHLLSLVFAKEDEEFQEVKKSFSQHCKYFFNVRRNITIVYDKPTLYVIHKEYLKIIDLKKPHNITDLAYNYKKNAVLYFTAEGHLALYFASAKSHLQIKKDFKRIFMLEWLYSAREWADFFVAEEAGIHLYRIHEEERRTVKQAKHLSGRYICYLYEPLSELLVGFQYGDCENALLFHFTAQKGKNWFRSGEMEVLFSKDEVMAERMKASKTLGLEGNRISKELFSKRKASEDNFIDIQSLHGVPYLIFYYGSEGKLQLTPLEQHSERKQLAIKLPSDSPPSFNIYDNMLVVHLRAERITFIYEINAAHFQPLVPPYSLPHHSPPLAPHVYDSEFLHTRALLPAGHISKWKVSLPAIYAFLKPEMQVFDFLTRRRSGKIEAIRWMRENLFRFRPIDLSKMWKAIFAKIASGSFDQNEIVSMIEIYTNLFYALAIDPLVDRLRLAHLLVECLRQAHEYRVPIPDELQLLTAHLLLAAQQHELLVVLAHHGIIAAQKTVYSAIFEKGRQEDSDLLLTLAVDMACQCAPPVEVLALIMASQRPREGKRFIKANFSRMHAHEMLQSAKYLSSQSVKQEFVNFLRIFFARKRLDAGHSETERKALA